MKGMKILVGVITLTAVSIARSSFAQAPDPRLGPSTPVTVVNTPLPVTGTVTGTVNATIVGTPEVKITNPASNPVPVQLGVVTRYDAQIINTISQPLFGTTLIPTVGAGATFIATYFNASGFSNNSSVPITDGECLLRLVAGNTNSPFGAFPVRVNLSVLVGSESTFLPIKAGESLKVACFVSPSTISADVFLSVGGYFVPAPQ